MDGLYEDPFLRTLFSRLPRHIAASFSAAQLDAIRTAFGTRGPDAHLVDLRWSIPLGRRSYYLVLLCGRNHRSPGRRALERLLRPMWSGAIAVVVAGLLTMGAGAIFSSLYVTKRALHINVVPGVDVLPDKTIERLLP